MTLGQTMRPRLADLEAVLPYLRRMESAGKYANGGPLARELEERHAVRLGVDPAQVVAVSSGTAGLTGAMSVSPARCWAVPAFTFAATGHAVTASGGSLDIRDVDGDTWLISAPGDLPGIVIVLPFGAGLSTAPWPDEAEVVVDAAASLGAAALDLSGLPAAWSVVFSLHATKIMPCGEGGLVVCGDPQRAEEIRRWAHFRLDEDRSATGPGANALLPEPSAAFGLAAMDGWDQEQADWRAARAHCDRVMAQLGLDGSPSAGADAHPYWVVRFPSPGSCKRAESTLLAAGVAARHWWGPGLHRMPAFRPPRPVACPVTDTLAATTLGLPFWRGLATTDAQWIGELIGSALDGVGSEE